MTSPLVAAVDIGGTKTDAALVRDGVVLTRTRAATPATDGAAAVLDTAAALVRSLRGDPVAVGVGAPGLVDPGTGLVTAATSSISDWTGVDVCAELAARLRRPSTVLNDVQAFTLGEAVHGAGQDRRLVVGVAIGTGIGGGLALDGRLLVGRLGAAGHLGHLPVPQATGLPCPCGSTGHVEAIAAGPAIAARYAHASGGPGTTLPRVVERAAAGDPAARHALAVAGAALGTALAGLANVLDPDLIVIGGGAAVPELLAAAAPAFAAGCMPVLGAVPLVPAGLGPDAALVGAATHAAQTLWPGGS
ncbi:ROK family protein [Plantactinospora sp. GCM10030261]|uniref:ROK family protein n=1 Tax=Plantactinospora sp. GCM10030261 TaxID=3273420 RepID=UPI0036131360